MKKLITTLTLLTFLVAGSIAQTTSAPAEKGIKAQNCPEMSRRGDYKGNRGGKSDHHFGARLKEMLDLTDEQAEKMHDIKIKYDKMEIDVKADQKKLGIDKSEAMKDMDFSKARKITKQISELRTKKQLMQIDQKEELSKILNKEQIEKMKKFHMMKNKGGKRDKMGKKDKRHMK